MGPWNIPCHNLTIEIHKRVSMTRFPEEAKSLTDWTDENVRSLSDLVEEIVKPFADVNYPLPAV